MYYNGNRVSNVSQRTRRRRLGGWCFLLALSATPAMVHAQPTPAIAEAPVTFDGRGVTVRGTDGITALNVRFRVQQVYAVTAADASGFDVTRTQFAVRRMPRLEARIPCGNSALLVSSAHQR